MKVIIAHSIRKKEFKGGDLPKADLATILKAYHKGIFSLIRDKNLPTGSKLIKIYATTARGARRIVFLVDVMSGDGFLLFYRDKKDRIGQNITIQNPFFREALHKHLRLLMSDIENSNYDQLE